MLQSLLCKLSQSNYFNAKHIFELFSNVLLVFILIIQRF